MPDHSRIPFAPSPSEQVRFLEQIQRLLSDGQFTATYKFALLHSLADLCVEKGDDVSGGSLTLTMADLAGRFAGLYRRQARPFPGRRETRVLKQNAGRQARVVTVLADSAVSGQGRFAPVPRRTLTEINETIRDQPLWKLQTLAGGERLEFLYENTDLYGTREITLKPGVAYCFRAFHGLIVALVRNRWEQWVRARNVEILGEAVDLREFLFGSERSDLSTFREALLEVQGRSCLYTGRTIGGEIVVDHFVPWARYPADLGHNLVLTSAQTNSRKSDHLAAEDHLDSWLELCIERRGELGNAFDSRGLQHSLPASLAIAEWSYAALDRSGGRVWQGGDEFGPLTGRWRSVLNDARGALGFL